MAEDPLEDGPVELRCGLWGEPGDGKNALLLGEVAKSARLGGIGEEELL